MEKQFIEEEFRPIEGFPGYYVSDLGRVLSNRRKNPVILSPKHNRSGYLYVLLTDSKGKRFGKRVNVLVANAFLPKRPSADHVVDHKNDLKTDNRACNLQWLTHQENSEKANAKPVICLETGKVYKSAAKAARAVDLSDAAVASAIYYNCKCAGLTWRYVE